MEHPILGTIAIHRKNKKTNNNEDNFELFGSDTDSEKKDKEDDEKGKTRYHDFIIENVLKNCFHENY